MTKLETLIQEHETLYNELKHATKEEADLLEIKLRAISYAIGIERDNQREKEIIDQQKINQQKEQETLDIQIEMHKNINKSKELNDKIYHITNLLNHYKSISPLEIKNNPSYQENIKKLENALTDIINQLTNNEA